MSEFKAALFDADGVLILAPRPFSHVHSEITSADKEKLHTLFFQGEDFRNAMVGKADLKELIAKHTDLWDWHEDPSLLLAKWFEGENHPNKELLKVIDAAQKLGVMCCLATDQEKYRAEYLRTKMFPNVFDRSFISSEVGYKKKDPEFFSIALEQLSEDIRSLEPENVVYFDDSQDNLDVAGRLGIVTILYTDVAQVKDVLGISP